MGPRRLKVKTGISLALLVAIGATMGMQMPRKSRYSWPDLHQFVARLQRVEPTTGAVSRQLPWTADMVRSVATLFNVRERAEKILEQWQESGSVEWSAPDGQSFQMSVGLARFTDAAAARAYFGLAIDLQRKQDEMLGPRLVDSRSETVQLAEADEAMRSQKSIRGPGDPSAPPLVIHGLIVRCDDIVLEFTRQGKPIAPNWGERVFATLLLESSR